MEQGRSLGGTALVVGGLALLVAACGGASDKKATSESTGSRAPAAAAQRSADITKPSSEAAGAAAAATVPSSVQAGAAAPAASTPSEPLPSAERKIIANVFLEMTVKDVQKEFERVATIAESNQGLISGSNLRLEGKTRLASITIRVPGERLQFVLVQLRALAVSVDSERSESKDVTEEYTDLQSRLRNLEATESQYLVFLGQAKTITDVVQMQERINATRAEIERVKGRINLLSRLSDLATIQVGLRPEPEPKPEPVVQTPKPKPGALASVGDAWGASLDVLAGIGIGLLTALAFSWWLAPLVAVAVWWGRREMRRRAPTTLPANPNTP